MQKCWVIKVHEGYDWRLQMGKQSLLGDSHQLNELNPAESFTNPDWWLWLMLKRNYRLPVRMFTILSLLGHYWKGAYSHSLCNSIADCIHWYLLWRLCAHSPLTFNFNKAFSSTQQPSTLLLFNLEPTATFKAQWVFFLFPFWSWQNHLHHIIISLLSCRRVIGP